MGGTKLDRANTSEVQYGTGAPDASTYGRIYYRTDTLTLYLKESTTWTPILGPDAGISHGQMAYWNHPAAAWTLTSLTELYFDESDKKLDVGDHVWMIGDTIFDLNLSTITTAAEVRGEGIVFDDVDTPFPTDIDLNLDTYNFQVGTWTYTSSAPQAGWYSSGLTAVGGPEAGGWLWPINRQGNWEVLIDYYVPTLAAGEKNRVIIAGRMANGQSAYFVQSVADGSTGWQYQAYLYTSDGDGTVTAEHSGTGIGGSNTFRLGLRMLNGCLGVYDDQDDSWHDVTTDWGDYSSYAIADLVLMVGTPSTTYEAPIFTNLSFKYL